jgi:uncharacterized membrane protein YfcA
MVVVHIDAGVVLAGLIVGFTVGLTGMGGGALMTPILVLFFKVTPLAAVSSDLVNSLLMKPVGGTVHFRKGTVQWDLVRWLALGSVPSGFAGVLLLRAAGQGSGVDAATKGLLGWALLVSAVALVAKALLQARANRRFAASGQRPNDVPYRIKPVATLLVGVVGGLIVGMTSVGSGSLMIVLLMLLYPRLSSKSLVGTDLVQAIPLVASAAVGHLLFGDVNFGITGSLVVGSVPGVYVGAHLSASAPDAVVRPALVIVLLSSALKLLGLTTAALATIVAAVVLTALPLWGAIDAATLPTVAWLRAGRSRTRWVALQGTLAPFGLGVLLATVYLVSVRPLVSAAVMSLPAGE